MLIYTPGDKSFPVTTWGMCQAGRKQKSWMTINLENINRVLAYNIFNCTVIKDILDHFDDKHKKV